MSAFTERELEYLSERRPGRLGRIATIGKDGTPHVVPVGWRFNPEVDAIDGDRPRIRIHPERIVSWGLESEDFTRRHSRAVEQG
jgi:hypothetical protein